MTRAIARLADNRYPGARKGKLGTRKRVGVGLPLGTPGSDRAGDAADVQPGCQSRGTSFLLAHGRAKVDAFQITDEELKEEVLRRPSGLAHRFFLIADPQRMIRSGARAVVAGPSRTGSPCCGDRFRRHLERLERDERGN
jgi:hypothetical protein